MDTVAALRKYNRWRRGLDAWHEDAGPNPRDIGEQIDAAADELERLRAENGRLRHALLTMLGETEDSDYMTGADQKRMALDALTPNAPAQGRP